MTDAESGVAQCKSNGLKQTIWAPSDAGDDAQLMQPNPGNLNKIYENLNKIYDWFDTFKPFRITC